MKIIRILLKIIILTIFILSPLLFIYNKNISYGATNNLIVQGSNATETIWLTLRQIYGYTDIATAAIMGNLKFESSMRSFADAQSCLGSNRRLIAERRFFL